MMNNPFHGFRISFDAILHNNLGMTQPYKTSL